MRIVVKKKINPRRFKTRRRLNPDLKRLEDIYIEFLGRHPSRIGDAIAPFDAPEVLSALGVIYSLRTDEGELIFGDESDLLLCSDDDKNLWVVGRDALLDDLRNHNLGEVYEITYLAKKDHLDNEPVLYVHEFGEEGGERPQAFVDEEGFLHLVGGDYQIRSEGIVD